MWLFYYLCIDYRQDVQDSDLCVDCSTVFKLTVLTKTISELLSSFPYKQNVNK